MRPIVLALISLCYLAASGHASAYDDSKSAEVLTNLVCKTHRGTKHLLSGLPALNTVADYLSHVASSHSLYECKQNYMESISRLVHVVQTANDNVCGEEKLALIEDYHRQFVSRVKRHVKARKETGLKAPKMIELFFMQYATEVSSVCEQVALAHVANKKQVLTPEEVEKVEKMRKFTDALGMTDLSHGYKGIYLFWNMVDSLSLSSNEKFSNYLTHEGETRLNVQMHDARGFNAIQAICRAHLKPTYARTMLPVLRLIDLGYYPHGSRLVDQLHNDVQMRGLFFATQMCETVLPLAVYSDSSLAADQFVAITKDEAAQLTLPQLEGIEKLTENRPIDDVPARSMDISKLEFDSATPVKTIKTSVKSRAHIINRMLKHLWRHLKEKMGSVFTGGMKLFRKDRGQKLEEVDEKALDRLEEENQLKISEEGETGLKRKKRGHWAEVGVIILYAIYATILTILKIAFFLVPVIFCAIAAGLFNSEVLAAAAEWMVSVGYL